MPAPYRIIDRRNASGYVAASANTLIEAATQTDDRKASPMLDVDVHRSISSYGRRVLMTLGRNMFWRYPALQGSILEQANISVSSFIPQYAGRNKEWGTVAEAMLNEWHKVMDVAGWPYDYDSFLQSKVIGPLVDGEDWVLLTENPDGYPLIQTIPAHRIGGRVFGNMVAKVRFTGKSLFIDEVLVDDNRPYEAPAEIAFDATVIDGVIVDAYSRAIAYRVFDDPLTSATYQDISARHLFPCFTPMMTGQVRGFSLLASSVFDWADMHEWKRFEMLAQKAFSTRTIVETNETGEVDAAKAIISGAATFDTEGKKTGLDVQKLEGGTIHYLRAGTGSKIQAFDYDRPGAQSQNFMNSALRDAFRGTEWDVFFSLDPQKVGGAPMRIIVEKINLVAAKRRKLVAKACRRVHGYALSKLIKLGLLPPDEDWFMWNYQGPGDVTSDKKYDSDVALQEIAMGIGTRKDEIARRGGYIEEVDAQRETEVRSDLDRAQRLAKEFGLTIQEAMIFLRPPSPNAQLPPPAPEPGPAPTA